MGHYGEASDVNGLLAETRDTPDIEYVLYVFATLTNIPKATIELPDSIASNFTLQDMTARHEQSMMNVNLVDEEFVNEMVELLEEDLNDSEPYIRQDTGRKSLAKFRGQGYHNMYTTARGHVRHFQETWPHMHSLPGNEYEGDMRYVCKCISRFWHNRGCSAMR